MTNQIEHLSGTVNRFLFQSADGFTVFILDINRETSTVVRGYTASIVAGQEVHLEGAWVFHQKFGKQFEAAKCTAAMPTSLTGLKKYLGSGLIKGIGKIYAEKLVDHFGRTVLEVIDKQPERLKEVSGIGPGRIEKITTAWKDQKEIAQIMVFLQDKGISSTYATKIYKKYGAESIALLNENPYRLADDIWGIGFKIADQIAKNLGIAHNAINRIKAGILFMISESLGFGHVYVEVAKLKEKTFVLLELDPHENATGMKLALHQLYERDAIKLVTHDNEHYITLSQYYYTEKGTAAKLLNLMNQPHNHSFDIEKIYSALRSDTSGIALNEDQQKGILETLQHKVSIITGGPGTGKTTLIKKLLSVLDAEGIRYQLAAPTGRAAKRIMEGTGKHAQTIHRLLEFDPYQGGFTKNEQNALNLNFLIIDEASMIDIFLGYAIVRALPWHAHVIFIGDIDQLPSVGAGNFLNDLIASNTVSVTRLTQIFRQAQDSMIIVNAHRVNQGEFPISSLPDARRDFIFIKEEQPENMRAHLHEIYSNTLKRHGIKPEDATVLVPMNRGTVGTHKLNHDLQTILNPHETDQKLTRMGSIYKIGDQVMQIRNNYDKNVFNGDIGTLQEVDLQEQMFTVAFDGRLVEYDVAELDELILAYAITIHKSQGSEYAAAIIPLFMQHFTLLQRNLIYTAITRAKKLCIIIGQPKAIGMAINNNKSIERKTFLKEFLTTDLQAR
ncbi:MAG: ATP-dependent RecD-like DNA helicase [Candidatus Babeliales bacterium]